MEFTQWMGIFRPFVLSGTRRQTDIPDSRQWHAVDIVQCVRCQALALVSSFWRPVFSGYHFSSFLSFLHTFCLGRLINNFPLFSRSAFFQLPASTLHPAVFANSPASIPSHIYAYH